jgi:hypothetical protein
VRVLRVGVQGVLQLVEVELLLAQLLLLLAVLSFMVLPCRRSG